MSEKLPNRREAAKADYENTERYQAIRTLRDSGFLISMNNLELYHGRSGDHLRWSVHPDFDNSDNNTGNANINKISALNTSSQDVASKFAAKRASSRNGVAEVHRIVSDDPDACIIDPLMDFSSLDHREREQVIAAIRKTLPGLTSGAPIDFAHRKALRGASPRDFITSDRTGFIYGEDLDRNARKLGIDSNLNLSLVSAKNTKHLLGSYPQLIRDLMYAYLGSKSSIRIRSDGRTHDVPISREYLSNWFREIHAVGCKTRVDSATLGHEVIDNYLLFDLEKVNTTTEIDANRKKLYRRFGKIALGLERHRSHSPLAENLNNNLYIQPSEILSLAKKTPGYKEIFESDAGNWEKFTLAEHTETVLRLFDDNYADYLPASTLPIMRLALLVHDIGKPEAVKNHNKQNQKAYNVSFAEDFMARNNIEPSNRELVLTMIGEGLDYATRWMVKREPDVGREFYGFCEKTMQRYLGKRQVDSETVTGFRNMLEVLQTCDSAAYTTMAVTRSVRNGVVYRNHGSFDQSFEQFHGLTGRRAKFSKK